MGNILINQIKKILGPSLSNIVAPVYHGSRGYLNAVRLNKPASKLIVIGITGTKGKTSTTVLLGRILNFAGIKTGCLSTALLNLNGGGQENEFQNPYKMTSIDSAKIQQSLSKMVDNSCKVVVIELSSEGLKQNRHIGLGKIDLALFLNLYPEHIESHGSLSNYMNAKAKLFANLKENGIFIGNGMRKEKNGKIIDDQLEKTNFMISKIKNAHTNIILTPDIDYQIVDSNLPHKKDLLVGSNKIVTNYFTIHENANFAFALKALEILDSKLYAKFIEFVTLNPLPQNIVSIPGRMDWIVLNGEIVN